MQLIFPLLMAVIGWGVGALVIIIVDALYWRREALSESCKQVIRDRGWIVYSVWPFYKNGLEQKKKIRNLLVNLFFSGLLVWLYSYHPSGINIYWSLLLWMYFSVVVIMDLEHRVVLHEVSWAGVILGLLFGVIRHGSLSTLLGGLVGFGLMYLGYILGTQYMRFKSRQRGEDIDEVALGFGDVNISGVIGLVLGWPGIIVGLVMGVFIGGLGSAMYYIYRKLSHTIQEFEAVPYAPFLVIGAILLLFFPGLLLG